MSARGRGGARSCRRARARKQCRYAAMARSEKWGTPARIRVSSSASVRWSSVGGVSFARQSSQAGYDWDRSITPPSTHAMPRTVVRVPPRQLQHHGAAPRLAGEHRALEAQRLDQGEEVGDRGLEIVAGVRGVRAAVTPLVDGDDACGRPCEAVRPRRPRAGGSTRARGRARTGAAARLPAPHLDMEPDAGSDVDPPLDRRHRGGRDRAGSCHGRQS